MWILGLKGEESRLLLGGVHLGRASCKTPWCVSRVINVHVALWFCLH